MRQIIIRSFVATTTRIHPRCCRVAVLQLLLMKRCYNTYEVITTQQHQQQQQQRRTFCATKRQKRVAAAAAAAAAGGGGGGTTNQQTTANKSNHNDDNNNEKPIQTRSSSSKEGSSTLLSRDDDADTTTNNNNNTNSSRSSNQVETQLKPTTLHKQQPQPQPQPLILDRLTPDIANNDEFFLAQTSLSSSSSSSSLSSPLLDLSGVVGATTTRTTRPGAATTTSSSSLDLLMPTAPTNWNGYEASTPLTEELMGRIVLAGRPLSIAEFMQTALTHPAAGYYTTATDKDDDDFDQDDYDDIWQDTTTTTTTSTTTTTTSTKTKRRNEVIGPEGDFVTAPEVSQVFGECLGVWFYMQWRQQQQLLLQHPQQQLQQQKEDQEAAMSFQWLECGPGRGSLLVDLLQFGRQLQLSDGNDDDDDDDDDDNHNNNNMARRKQFWIEHCSAIHLVEASPIMQSKQQEVLEQWQQQQQLQKTNHRDNESSNQPDSPLIFLDFYNHKSGNMGVDTPPLPPFSKKSTGSSSSTTTTTDSNSNPRHNSHHIPVHWHDSLQAFMLWQQQQKEQQQTSLLPPVFAVCQEFLDALPIYSFEKSSEGYWRERLIDVALRDDMMDLDDEQELDDISNHTTKSRSAEESSSNNQDSSSLSSSASAATMSPPPPPQDKKKPRLRIVLAPEATPALKTLLQADQEGFVEDPVLKDAPTGSVVEVSPDSMIVVHDLAKIIKEQGGASLVIDYGQEGSTDSIRGFSKHKQVHFLSYPGKIDVTADVDFAAMRHAVSSANNRKNEESSIAEQAPPVVGARERINEELFQARAFGPTDQGEFLIAMGIQQRVIQLIERDDVTDEKAEDLYNAMVRLVSSEEMGKRYKVMCIVPTLNESDSPPPGF